MELKRVGVGSAAKVAGTLYAVMGLLFGCGIAAAGALGGSLFPAEAAGKAGPVFGLLMGMGAIFVLPILYGLMGILSGAIGAALYNLIAGLIGGIELELE